MKTHIRFIARLLLLMPCGLYAQSEFYNNGSSVSVQSGGLIYVQGEVVNNNAGANTGFITNNGLIQLSGNWTNTSASAALAPTTGTVELYGANQLIQGTQPTRFNYLNLTGTGVKTLGVNTYAGGNTAVLSLNDRPLDLNSNTLIMTNPLPSGITRTSGYIISETAPVPGYGIVQWDLGNAAGGNYTYPFGTFNGDYIPLNITITTPGVQTTTGSINASTYPTVPVPALNNRPMPTGVADLDNNCQTEHSRNMVDRYWVIDAGNYINSPVADKKFTYLDSEWDASGGSSNLISEPELQSLYYASGWTHLAGTENSTANEFDLANNANYGVFTLGLYKELQLQLLDTDSARCYGQNSGAIQFTSTQGYGINTYYWNGASSSDTIRTNLGAGTYTIIAEDIMGCRDTLNNILIEQPLQMLMNVVSDDYSVCANDAIHLVATFSGGIKPYVVNWSGGSSVSAVNGSTLTQTYHPTVSGTYWASFTDAHNCPAVGDTVAINVNALPQFDFSALPQAGCMPLGVSFSLAAPVPTNITNWLWSFGTGANSALATPQYTYYLPGSYNVSLKATSDSGCVNTVSKAAYITVYPKPQADFSYSPETPDYLNPELSFSDQSTGGGGGIHWDFGDGQTTTGIYNPQHIYSDTGNYLVRLIVSSPQVCLDTMVKHLTVYDISVLYVPNAFTPGNPDGKNDLFHVVGTGFYDFHLMIFNRWGTLIFETDDAYKGWDGTYRGTLCQEGVYVYKLVYKPLNGRGKGIDKEKVGHVTLLR